MSYYDSKFYQRWFTMNTLSPAERGWWVVGLIEGIVVAASCSHAIKDAVTAICHNGAVAIVLNLVVWIVCAFLFSEAARAVWRRRQAEARK